MGKYFTRSPYLVIKWIGGLSEEKTTNYICFYIESHCQTKTADTEHIFPNPILHDISPPSSWEL